MATKLDTNVKNSQKVLPKIIIFGCVYKLRCQRIGQAIPSDGDTA